MNNKPANHKIIFGLKVRQLRHEKNMSFDDLKKLTGISVSYLNEIEKGKKYPSDDKIHALAKALETSFNELTSHELTDSLAPLGELLDSNFLNELPLELFGIELSKVVEIIAGAPARVGAFISTLVEIARNYSLIEENFYLGAMRSYQELHYNYFEDIEMAVLDFSEKYGLPKDQPPGVDLLEKILKKHYRYGIVENGLKDFPELQNLPSVFVPKSKKLLLNGQLSEVEKKFQLGKELGYKVLKLNSRESNASFLRVDSFDEALSHFKAEYFSTALLINPDAFVKDTKVFFTNQHWNGKAFLDIMHKYKATPEMFFQRLTNILPRFFGLQKMFFLRVNHNLNSSLFEIEKELHLHHQHHPHSNGLHEHYCRRWLSVSLLNDLHALQTEGKYTGTIVGAQRCHYVGTDDEYLCITVAKAAAHTSSQQFSVTIGLLFTEELRAVVGFCNDPSITTREVNKTCERCAIPDCAERAAPATVIEKRQQRKAIRDSLKKIMEE